MELFDTHCHLDFNDFDHDRDHVINNAKQHGVNNILIPAVAQKTWHQTIDLCQQSETCHLALGLHPMFIDQHQPQHLNELDDLVSAHKPIAIGEIGNRKAHDPCLSMLKEHDINGGIIHAFNGSIQQAQKYIEMGFMLGFGGMLTFERSSKLHSSRHDGISAFRRT